MNNVSLLPTMLENSSYDNIDPEVMEKVAFFWGQPEPENRFHFWGYPQPPKKKKSFLGTVAKGALGLGIIAGGLYGAHKYMGLDSAGYKSVAGDIKDKVKSKAEEFGQKFDRATGQQEQAAPKTEATAEPSVIKQTTEDYKNKLNSMLTDPKDIISSDPRVTERIRQTNKDYVDQASSNTMGSVGVTNASSSSGGVSVTDKYKAQSGLKNLEPEANTGVKGESTFPAEQTKLKRPSATLPFGPEGLNLPSNTSNKSTTEKYLQNASPSNEEVKKTNQDYVNQSNIKKETKFITPEQHTKLKQLINNTKEEIARNSNTVEQKAPLSYTPKASIESKRDPIPQNELKKQNVSSIVTEEQRKALAEIGRTTGAPVPAKAPKTHLKKIFHTIGAGHDL